MRESVGSSPTRFGCVTWRALVSILLFASSLHLSAQERDDSGELVGLWSAEVVGGPSVDGPLWIDGRQEPWIAQIGGARARVDRRGAHLAFELPGASGRFRGTLVDGRIPGHWIQPARRANGTAYATPTELRSTDHGVWAGTVSPLPDQLSFFIAIGRKQDGSVEASLFNPEQNIGFRARYSVTLRNGALLLRHTANPDAKVVGRASAEQGWLEVDVLGRGIPLRFTRQTGEESIGFAPMVADRPYVYRPPPATGDGWRTAAADEVGLDVQPLIRMVEEVILRGNASTTAPRIHAVLVARHGRLVFEEYFFGYHRNRPHDMRSASKTFTSVMLGVANHQRKVDLADSVAEFFPLDEHAPQARISVRDLITMTSGLACDDNDEASPGNEENMQSQPDPDWYAYTLALPMVAAPGGSRAIYCSAGINLVGGVIAHATGSWLPEFFHQYVAVPLDFGSYHMNLMPNGEGYAAGGLHLTPRDQLKLGQLYLNGGVWNDKVVVAREWVSASTREQSRFTAEHGYGLAWHLRTVSVNGRAVDLYSAEGNGGQVITVVPDLDLVALFNGGNYGNFPTWIRYVTEFLPKYILVGVSAEPHAGATTSAPP